MVCDGSVYSFIEIVIKTKRRFFSVFKVKKKKKKVIVKVREKARDEEGGKSENDKKRLCTNGMSGLERMKTVWKKWCL